MSQQLYLELMKKCLMNTIYEGNHIRRLEGRDWPKKAHTMIGLKRLNNIQYCLETILSEQIPGDLVEVGVWRGGASIFMKAILEAYHIDARLLWVADSFKGFSFFHHKKRWFTRQILYPFVPGVKVPLKKVQNNFKQYGLLDDRVKFLEGWAQETLPTAPFGDLALIRIDCDSFEATLAALNSLYRLLSAGGFVIVDDYGCFQECREAVEEFRQKNGIVEEIIPIDWTGIYWRKTNSSNR